LVSISCHLAPIDELGWKVITTGFQNDHETSIGERRKCRYANGLGILEFDGKRYELKTERKDRTFAAGKLMGPDHHRVLCIHPTFPYRIKRAVLARPAILSDAPTSIKQTLKMLCCAAAAIKVNFKQYFPNAKQMKCMQRGRYHSCSKNGAGASKKKQERIDETMRTLQA
jgi:hypothetical protein